MCEIRNERNEPICPVIYRKPVFLSSYMDRIFYYKLCVRWYNVCSWLKVEVSECFNGTVLALLPFTVH